MFFEYDCGQDDAVDGANDGEDGEPKPIGGGWDVFLYRVLEGEVGEQAYGGSAKHGVCFVIVRAGVPCLTKDFLMTVKVAARRADSKAVARLTFMSDFRRYG